jgi:hypothetical protein
MMVAIVGDCLFFQLMDDGDLMVAIGDVDSWVPSSSWW